MTSLTVTDITSYLRQSGWRSEPETWRGGTVWLHDGDHELLVPPSDDLGDAERRKRDILRTLAAVERRLEEDIAREIGSPAADLQLFRIFPDGLPSGFAGLADGMQAVQGIHEVFLAGARAALEGPRSSFSGRPSTRVREFLNTVSLGPARAGSYVLTVWVPLGGRREGYGRDVVTRVHAAVRAAQSAAVDPAAGPAAFERAVTAGVSSALCEGLARLSGPAFSRGFEVGFRWGRAIPTTVPADRIEFGPGSGEALRTGARHLRERSGREALDTVQAASLTGVVEGLYDDPSGTDRWRVQIRGALTTAAGASRPHTTWVRLATRDEYLSAIAAHRANRRVRAFLPPAGDADEPPTIHPGGFTALD